MREIVVSIQGRGNLWMPMPESALLRTVRIHVFDPLTWESEAVYEGTLKELVEELVQRLSSTTNAATLEDDC